MTSAVELSEQSNNSSDTPDDVIYNYSQNNVMESILKQVKCIEEDFENRIQVYREIGDDHLSVCNTTFDGAVCWPTSSGPAHVLLPCPQYLQGHPTFMQGNASKYCYSNGTWNEWTDYTGCTVVRAEDLHGLVQVVIYVVGYTLSTVALLVALCIFLHFRVLKCLRNSIHCHLIVTFILKNMTWLALYLLLPRIDDVEHEATQWLCKIAITLYNYLHVTNFFWMLVEGIYLLFLVVFAFLKDQIKMCYLIVIGWLIPVPVIVTWAIVKYKYENDRCWIKYDSLYSYIHVVPVLLVLLINAFILVSIVYILVTKLRATNCAHGRQSRKAIKATVILLPLLGLTYLLFISPYSNSDIEHHVFKYFNALLQSIQGLEVAVFYCFLNSEVKAVLRNRFSQWRDERSVATRFTRASMVSTGEHSIYRNTNDSENYTRTRSNGIRSSAQIPLTSIDGRNDELL